MAVTGVDILIRGKDETEPAMRSVMGRLGTLEAGSGKLGAKVGQQMAGQLQATFVQYMGAKAIDGALRSALDAAKNGADWSEVGMAAAESFVDGLKQVPIAGAVGEILANAIDYTGDLAMERAQAKAREAAETIREIYASADDLVRSLRRDTLTEAQRRQEDFDRQLRPILDRAAKAGQAVAPLRDQLQAEFDASEQRRTAAEFEKAAGRSVPFAASITRAELFGRNADLMREQRRANELLAEIAAKMPQVTTNP